MGGHPCATYIFPYDIPLFLHPLPYDWKERKIVKPILKNKKVVVELTGSRSTFLLHLIVGSSWPASEVTQEYLQKLVRKVYMTVVEIATCLVQTVPASPSSVKGLVVVCAAFYDWGFGAPPHRFFYTLLRCYGWSYVT
jgi:hypothetical protein